MARNSDSKHEHYVRLDATPFMERVHIGPRVRDGYHAVLMRYGKPFTEFVISPSQVAKVRRGKGRLLITRGMKEKARSRWGYPRDFDYDVDA